MTWLLIAYLLGMLYFMGNPKKVLNKGLFRIAWICFALIPICHFVGAMFKAGNIRSARDLTLVAVWFDGLSWLFIGISFFFLLDALMPGDAKGAETRWWIFKSDPAVKSVPAASSDAPSYTPISERPDQ